ncbi:MAG: hypothetical protein LUD27_03940 [Clostridia bacterium]|nr:hypothetical protein [Clostridia bacterium]
MKQSNRDRVRQMEREDELGISRQKNRKPLVSLKVYKILKICLIAAIPVVYFMCSPLLIAVMAGWIVLLVITNSIERSYNAGLKKELRTRFPKTDCILCIIIVALTAICIAVSEISAATHSNNFDGMSGSEISSALKNTSLMVWHRVESILKNIGSCMTGTRWLFQSEMSLRASSDDSAVAEAPGGGGDLSSMLSDMPFSMIFESIIKAVCTALLLVVVILGILALVKLKKLGVDDVTLSDKERKRRLKMEEERLAKERAKRNYFSVKKSDFSQAEQDLLADLAFLFDPETEEDALSESSENGALAEDDSEQSPTEDKNTDHS